MTNLADNWLRRHRLTVADFHRMGETGILRPDARVELIEAPTAGNSATCKSCAHCPWMAMNSLQGLVDCLEQGSGAIEVPEPVRGEALGCIQRMLDFVAANPAAIARPAQDRTNDPVAGIVPGIGAA